MNRNYWYALGILIGTTIGAGIQGIPKAVASSGLLTGLAVIIFIGLVVLAVNLMLGEVVLRTAGNHQLTGYAEKYLGKWGKHIMTLTMTSGVYGALIAYTIGVGKALGAIFSLPSFWFSIGFFVVFSFLVYFGLNVLRESELDLSIIMWIIIFITMFIAFFYVDVNNFTGFNVSEFFTPYGVVLFAFLGASAIPMMKETLTKERSELFSAIIWGAVISIITYVLFALIIVGVTGSKTTDVATIGLGQIIGYKMIIFGNIFAIFAMSTSFLALAFALKEMYDYDYKLNPNLSWALTCLPAIIIFLLGWENFTETLSVTGTVAGGIEGILLVLIWMVARKRSEKNPEYNLKFGYSISAIIILTFLIGLVYYLSTLF
ncbi:hypothetical protein J4468_03280 [Candidatus Woesearchaeota archaeon]|nr:hypothetical protein [Candidatus Woesearchaeota archaeon]